MLFKYIVASVLTIVTASSADFNLNSGYREIVNQQSYENISLSNNSYVRISASGEFVGTNSVFVIESSGIEVFDSGVLRANSLELDSVLQGVESSWVKIQSGGTAHIDSLILKDYGYFETQAGSSVFINKIDFHTPSLSAEYNNLKLFGGNVTLGGSSMVANSLDANVYLGENLSLNLLGTLNANKISVNSAGFTMLVTDETYWSWARQSVDNSFDVFSITVADITAQTFLENALRQALTAYNADKSFTVGWRTDGEFLKLTVGNLVPESSTSSLGLVGLTALLMRRRRPSC